jgi:hypothetical protein
MFISNLFMAPQVFYNMVKNTLENSSIRIRFNLLINSFIDHVYESILVPEEAIT